MKGRHIIIFDGECCLCNASVRFVIRHDRKARFCFIHQQTQKARSLVAGYGLELRDLESIVLIKDDIPYLRSKAVFEIIKDLDGIWSLLRVLEFLPRPFTDFFYRYVAKRRYAMFGKSQECAVLSAEMMSRFLTDET